MQLESDQAHRISDLCTRDTLAAWRMSQVNALEYVVHLMRRLILVIRIRNARCQTIERLTIAD